MRLVCPNCDAQYEVPLDVIPENGRDVQCSNCGHTWFQAHPDQPAPIEEPAEQPAAEERQPEPATEARRRKLDPEVANVLRAEAEREAQARAAERDRLESQPDLGLEEPRAQRKEYPPEAPAAPRKPVAEAKPGKPKRPAGRGALLPDIDELNSTLTTGAEQREIERKAAEDAELEEDASSNGFGGGVRAASLAIVLLLAIYVFSPKIIEMVPQAEPFLTPFVTMVDQVRIWLEQQFQSLLGLLDSMSSEAGQ